MFPVGIVGRSKFRPYVSFYILAINIIVFFIEFLIYTQGEAAYVSFFERFALSTCRIGVDPIHLTLRNGFFSLFLHASPVHLLSNMAFLWVFAPRVEEYLGHKRFLTFYVVIGFVAHMAHILFASVVCDTALPGGGGIMIGASGAIAGVMGAFLCIHPGAKVRTALILRLPIIGGVPFGYINIYAVFYLIFWFAMDIMGLFSADATNVAHWAHIGGFVMGFVFIFMASMVKPIPKPDPFEYLDD